MINLDFVLEIVIEVLLQKNLEQENDLRELFIRGDTDGDGVLSFQEFQGVLLFYCFFLALCFLVFFTIQYNTIQYNTIQYNTMQ